MSTSRCGRSMGFSLALPAYCSECFSAFRPIASARLPRVRSRLSFWADLAASPALIAAYVVGYLETITAYLISPAYRTIPALLLLVAVMYVSPRGLLGASLNGFTVDEPHSFDRPGRDSAGLLLAALGLRLHSRLADARVLFRP